jgi:hypothetical protein
MLKFELLGTAVFGEVHRAKVPVGWLIYIYHKSYYEEYPFAHGGLTFYPDATHEWNGESLP